MKSVVPGLSVDAGAVEERRHQILSRTEAAQHQADPVQRGDHEHREAQQETAMVCLSNTAVNPEKPQHRHTTQCSHLEVFVYFKCNIPNHRHLY